MSKNLKTSDIAKTVGLHVNTVRLYEAEGYLSAVPRNSTGCRQYTQLHLEQMKLAHLALQVPSSTDSGTDHSNVPRLPGKFGYRWRINVMRQEAQKAFGKPQFANGIKYMSKVI